MRRGLRRPLAGLMAAAALWGAGGCGDSPPSVDSSKTEATVKGVVKVAGAPATEGEISFNPANYQRKDATIRVAPIGKDGTYSVTTLTGRNEVRLGGTLAHKKPILSREVRSVDVPSGGTTFDFEVKSADWDPPAFPARMGGAAPKSADPRGAPSQMAIASRSGRSRRSAQYWSAETTSPLPRVPMLHHAWALTVALTNRTEPSQNSTLTPPEWLLVAL